LVGGAPDGTERAAELLKSAILPHADAPAQRPRAPRGRRTMSIIENRKAFHDYFIEEKHEAGMVLEGWEVKAIRAGRANIKESYVVIRGEEIFLFGMHITPLTTASSHVRHDPTRTRKLLLHKKEIARLIGKVERAGYTLVPLDLHYKQGRIKLEIGLAKGKKLHDKREDEKKKDWEREKQRLMRVKACGRQSRRGLPRAGASIAGRFPR
jgi:SsrA-binding protein